jgi:hypothetical protein
MLDDVGEQRGRPDARSPPADARTPCSSGRCLIETRRSGRREIVFHLAEQIGAAGDHGDLAVLLPQLGRSLFEGRAAGGS